MNKSIKNFYEIIDSIEKQLRTEVPSMTYVNKQSHVDLLRSSIGSYLNSLSKKEFLSFVSNKHWNKYPLFVCTSLKKQGSLRKALFTFFYNVIDDYIAFNKEYSQILIKHSEGVFRYITINRVMGNERLKAAKYGLLSKDVRVRKLAASIVPISVLKKHIESFDENNRNVFKVIRNRIGIDNMRDVLKKMCEFSDKTFFNDYEKIYYHKKVFEVEPLQNVLEELEKIGFYSFERRRCSNNLQEIIAYNVNRENAPFFVSAFEHKDTSQLAKEIFFKKLTGKDLT